MLKCFYKIKERTCLNLFSNNTHGLYKLFANVGVRLSSSNLKQFPITNAPALSPLALVRTRNKASKYKSFIKTFYLTLYDL